MDKERALKNCLKALGIVGMITLTIGGWKSHLLLTVLGLISSIIAYMLQIFR